MLGQMDCLTISTMYTALLGLLQILFSISGPFGVCAKTSIKKWNTGILPPWELLQSGLPPSNQAQYLHPAPVCMTAKRTRQTQAMRKWATMNMSLTCGPVSQLHFSNKCNLTAGHYPRSTFVSWSACVFFWPGAGILQAKSTNHSLAENNYLRWTSHWGHPETCSDDGEKEKSLLLTPGDIQGLIRLPKHKCVVLLKTSLDIWDSHRYDTKPMTDTCPPGSDLQRAGQIH